MTPFTLLAFDYEGTPFDLAGRRDEDDCWVERVCVAGTPYDISDHLAKGVIDRIAELADAQLARDAVEHNEQARIDAYQMAA